MMKLSLQLDGKNYRVDSSFHDLSIALQFDGPQPNTYGVETATAKAYETSGFVGDVRRGGSCNFESYQLVPHCNGTHTECIGHLAQARIRIVDELREAFIPATLVTVPLVKAISCGESYPIAFNAEDEVITAAELKKALASSPRAFCDALIIRTTPNDAGKKSRDYMKEVPGFFTLDAMQFIRSCGVRHLLTDLPSVDRLFDEGKLGAHRVYWDVEAGSSEIDTKKHSAATITEMIFVADEIHDGIYLLNLQIAPFVADASPSRPVIFALYAE
jgi:arylformamidase